MHLKAVGLAMLIAMSLVATVGPGCDRKASQLGALSRRAKRPRKVGAWSEGATSLDASVSPRGIA